MIHPTTRFDDIEPAMVGLLKVRGGGGKVFSFFHFRAHAHAHLSTPQSMQAGEEEHLRTLNRALGEMRVRPSVLVPIWRVCGFALGAVSALAGKGTAMATTVAIETSISAHYNDQVRTLIKRGPGGMEPQQGAAPV